MTRAARVNECGHPERKHKAKGMCAACYYHSDSERRSRSIARKRERLMNDPEYRARKNERDREHYLRDPERRSRCIARKCERFAGDPEYRARKNAQQREFRNNPRYRALENARRRERLLTDPEYRARKNAQQREYCARVKAQKALQCSNS